MKNLTLSILLLACTACSTMEFNTSARGPFMVAALKDSKKRVSVESTKDFYFWGLSPEYGEFDLQDEMQGQGIYNPSYVAVEQRYTFKDVFFTFITLGLYCPVTYKVTLLTNGEVK
jgi:hypothetical protein